MTVFLVAVWASLLGPVTVTPVAGADQPVATLSKAERNVLWTRNIDLVDQARAHVGGWETLEAQASILKDPRVAKWVKDVQQEVTDQEARRREHFDRYVDRAQKHLDKNEIREALVEANRALDYAKDKDDVLKAEWTRRLTDATVAFATELRKEKEWRKAYEVYYNLSTLFEDNKDYEKACEDCLTYARLDVVYEKDANWEERLENIVPRNANDALDRIDKYYVEEADFQKLTAAGLENVLLICDSSVMRETFPGLADEFDREVFRDRLKARLDQVRQSGQFSVRDAKAHFRRALEINEDTVRLPEALMVYEFMSGALKTLDDFTSMIWPVEFKEFDKHTRGDFVGVGISISGGGDRPINVVSPLPNTPAYRAGITAGDQIVKVNDMPLKGVTLTKAVQTITGPIGTDVKLTIYRPSESREFDITLQREKIEIESVMGVRRDPEDPQKWLYMLDEELGIAYVQVISFQDNTVDQLRLAIDEAVADGARGLILDLRFNPGGLLKAAVEVTSLFQSADELVVSTRGLRDRPWSPPQPYHDGPFVSLPLIVLVNEYSASASEIVSGALEDNDRAIVLGERTYGKFSVQKLMELGGSSAHLKLTTARYYLPKGRSLHHEEGATEWGVAPDVEVKLLPKEVARVRLMQQARDLLARAADEKADKDADKSGDEKSDETAKADEGKDQRDEGTEGQKDEVATDDGESAKPEAGTAAKDAQGTEDLEGDELAEGDEEDEEDKLNLEPDPNDVPDVDLQLDTAVLLMRLHLIGENSLELAAGEEDTLKPKVGHP